MGGVNEKGACAVFIALWMDDQYLAQNADGKYYWTRFDPECGHAMTFCGYDDNFEADLNNDGRITNNEDINRDGNIDRLD